MDWGDGAGEGFRGPFGGELESSLSVEFCPRLALPSALYLDAMVLHIRFAIHGLRNNKYFHLVVMNAKTRRDAAPIETLGVYRPRIDKSKGEEMKTCEWSVDRIKYWLGVGAIPTKSAARLLALVRGSLLLL